MIYHVRKACEEYVEDVKKLAYKLLELIAMSLNLPAKRLNEFFEDSISYTRLNHYNPCPSPDLVLGLGRHKDGGALTILFQDEVGGLDVKRKVDGEWVRVKPVHDSFIVNIGDVMQVCSILISCFQYLYLNVYGFDIILDRFNLVNYFN